MSKLLLLKEWLTLDDAARHLTSVLKEPVAPADILQLALEGQLVLSVNLVNHAQATRRFIKSAEEAGTWKMPVPITLPEDLAPPDPRGRRVRRKDAPHRGWEEHEFPAGTPLDDGRILCYGDDSLHTLVGVWDLAMLGGERIAVERELHNLIGGPSVELVNIDGSFLASLETPDEIWSLHEVDEKRKTNPAWAASKRAGESTEGIPPYLDELEKFEYPMSGLPEGSMLVVRVTHLQRFLTELELLGGPVEITPKEEHSYQAVIGALLGMMLEQVGNATRSGYKDQAAIIDGILARHPDVPGLKKRSLEDKFAKSRRRLRE